MVLTFVTNVDNICKYSSIKRDIIYGRSQMAVIVLSFCQQDTVKLYVMFCYRTFDHLRGKTRSSIVICVIAFNFFDDGPSKKVFTTRPGNTICW